MYTPNLSHLIAQSALAAGLVLGFVITLATVALALLPWCLS